ncbi:hypothetical protein Pgin02_02015 [Porphyromonas gingivalis]
MLNELLNSISCNGRSNIFCHFHLGTETALVFPINEIFNIFLIFFGYDDDHTTILLFFNRRIARSFIIHEDALIDIFEACESAVLNQANRILARFSCFAHSYNDFRIDAEGLCNRVILERSKVYYLTTYIAQDERIAQRSDFAREELVFIIALSVHVGDLIRIFSARDNTFRGSDQHILLFDEFGRNYLYLHRTCFRNGKRTGKNGQYRRTFLRDIDTFGEGRHLSYPFGGLYACELKIVHTELHLGHRLLSGEQSYLWVATALCRLCKRHSSQQRGECYDRNDPAKILFHLLELVFYL